MVYVTTYLMKILIMYEAWKVIIFKFKHSLIEPTGNQLTGFVTSSVFA